ncbi:MAG: hypothetical protein ACREPD_15585 [Stenotrophomonas sp.]|uniref:hypothetical protein n=1 Tax=Gammaproteobacteria TaxID=1236 RepID=UPI003D6D75EB
MSAEEKKMVFVWEVVKAACSLILVCVVSVKIYQTPLEFKVDFPTLLSLLLAMFSVALAALFYFKATDTSNAFYDNTYKFTRDIAQLLAKMESGFGERLRHLDEGYSSMRNYLQDGGHKGGGEVADLTKKKLEDEKQEVSKAMEERNRMVRDLIERSNLQKEEKDRFSNELKAKEQELASLQREVAKLNRRMMMERVRKHGPDFELIPPDEGMNRFTLSHVIEKIGKEKLLRLSPTGVQRAFDRIAGDLPSGYLEDLERLEFFDERLTPAGASYLRALAHRNVL